MNKYIFLIPAGIIVILAIISTSIISTFVGLSSLNSQNNLGSTLTTINATDLIKDSRAVINANLANLNADKLERSAWFGTTTAPQLTTLANLATVGTITSGTWNGTTLTVAKGGTGSTTLSSNQVLLGNGASAIIQVAGLGTSGMFLTSGGAGVPPTWTSASVNQALDYIWTGYHTFANAGFTMATGTFAMSSSSVSQYPTASTSVATKGYVDAKVMPYTFGADSVSSASQVQTIAHGLGVTPTKIKITVNSFLSTYNNFISTGIYDGTSYATVYGSDDGSGNTTSYVVYLKNSSNTMWATSTLDSTNITLGWTETNTFPSTVYYLWEAWKN